MMTDEVTKALLDMYEKHREYLAAGVERMTYLSNKFPKSHVFPNHREALKLALDNLVTLFGEE